MSDSMLICMLWPVETKPHGCRGGRGWAGQGGTSSAATVICLGGCSGLLTLLQLALSLARPAGNLENPSQFQMHGRSSAWSTCCCCRTTLLQGCLLLQAASACLNFEPFACMWSQNVFQLEMMNLNYLAASSWLACRGSLNGRRRAIGAATTIICIRSCSSAQWPTSTHLTGYDWPSWLGWRTG